MKKILKPIPGAVFLKRKLIAVTSEIYNDQNVVMLHTGRCGSTVLSNMLGRRSDVFWAGEIFEPFMNSQTKVNDFHKVISSNREKEIARVFGFEIKHLKQLHLSSKCIDLNLAVLINKLKEIKNIKFIVLERENYLRRAISAQVAREKKILAY